MSEQRIGETVAAEILIPLMSELTDHSWRAQERQAEGRIVRLVPAVLRVVEHREAAAGFLRGEICPLLGWHLVPLTAIVAAFDDSQPEVIGGFGAGGRDPKYRLEKPSPGLPFHFVENLQPPAGVTSGERDPLVEDGARGLPSNLQAPPDRSGFQNADAGRSRDSLGRGAGDVVEEHFPRRPPCRAIVQQLETSGCRQQLALETLVEEAGEISTGVELDPVELVLQARFGNLDVGHRGGGFLSLQDLEHLYRKFVLFIGYYTRLLSVCQDKCSIRQTTVIFRAENISFIYY